MQSTDQDTEAILYDTKVVETCNYTCVKIHLMYNTKSET